MSGQIIYFVLMGVSYHATFPAAESVLIPMISDSLERYSESW